MVPLLIPFSIAVALLFLPDTPTKQVVPAAVTKPHKLLAQSHVVKELYRGLPTTLKIPAINVDTSFEYTGLTKSGDMIAPNNPAKAGWYKYGAIPGETGSAVVAGHVVGLKGEPAVFANLSKLREGDLLLVTDSKNQVASFTVREIRTYNQQEQHKEVFDSGAGTHLNIITCAGDWDSSQHHYVERLVVFADKTVKT